MKQRLVDINELYKYFGIYQDENTGKGVCQWCSNKKDCELGTEENVSAICEFLDNMEEAEAIRVDTLDALCKLGIK